MNGLRVDERDGASRQTRDEVDWNRWLGPRGRYVGMDRFGASAPGAENARRFGFTVENVLAVAREALAD